MTQGFIADETFALLCGTIFVSIGAGIRLVQNMFGKISTKILVLFVVNVIVWISLLGVIFYFLAARSLENQLNSTLKTTASVLASQWDGSILISLQPGMESSPLYRSFGEKLNLLKLKTNVEGIYIAALDRSCIVSSETGCLIGQPIPRLDLLQDQIQDAWNGKVATSPLVRVGNHDYKSAIAPVYSRDKVVAVLMIDMSPQYLIYLKSFRNSLIAFTIIALICCIVSARLFSRSITTPISRMLERVEEIGKARYEKPLEVRGTDELATLAESIESMRKNILQRDLQMKMMLRGIAHEIRNPLAGMELFAGILSKEIRDETQQQYVNRIQSEIQHLKQLLNEFLDFAKPFNLQKRETPVSDLASELQALLSRDIQEKKAKWTFLIHPEVHSVNVDRMKIKQALLNLYKNAFQALPTSGEVSSEIRRNEKGILVEIRNTQSSQIAAEVTEKMFEPFFTTREKGMGLGLPLARDIIEAHGGTIRLAENNQNFALFAIHLPDHSGTQAAQSEPVS